MKKKRKIINCVFGLLLIASLTDAGYAVEVEELTLDKAIEIALKSNPSLRQTANQVKLGEISVKQRKTNFYPDLNLSANSTKQYSKTLNQGTGLYENNNNTNLNLSLSSNVNLFNGFYDIASLQQTKSELKAAKGNLSRYSQAIVFETIQRYIQVITASESIKVETENLEAQRLQLIRVDEFVKAGRRPVTDLYQQKAEISRSEYRLLEAERNYKLNKLLLLQTLGIEAGVDYRVTGLDIDASIKETQEFDEDNMLKEALIRRPDIDAQQQQVEAAQKGVTASRSGYWPKLSFFTDIATNYSSMNELDGLSKQLFDNNPNATIGLSLFVPLFDKGTTKNSVASAKVQLANQQLESKKLEQQVGVEIRQAIEDYNTARKQVDVAESQLKYAQSALESVQGRYNVNAATMVELTLARTQYLEARYSRIEAKFNLLLRGIAVMFYQGTLNSNID
ncbi:MAG: TolC family protein [Candidatus Aminicenantes bacterium]|nr:TolC family protein [Candidatus Aminicenantes bacterium]